MRKFINRIIPFLFAGIALVALAFSIMILAYLFFIGALVGLTLFLITLIKNKLFPPKNLQPPPPRSGRIIDSSDWKEL